MLWKAQSEVTEDKPHAPNANEIILNLLLV